MKTEAVLKRIFQPLLLLHILLLLLGSLAAQNSARLDESDRISIGAPQLRTRMAIDAGRAAPDLPMRHMVLFLAPYGNSRASRGAVLPQVFPAMPMDRYWHWNREAINLSGLDEPAQLAAIWLGSHGLLIEPVPPRLHVIPFHGTVTQVERAFHIEIHNFVLGGKTYYANVDPPTIPRALMRSIRAVSSMDNFPVPAGSGSAGISETPLYSFTGAYYGSVSGVVADSSGNLYGTTVGSGAAGNGTVFKLDATGNRTVFYSFTSSDGTPQGGLIIDGAGNLYGTTYFGGSFGNGIVFKLDPAGHETVLCSITSIGNGTAASGGLAMDGAGNLYGTASSGGSSGQDVLFKVDTKGNETVLYNFPGFGITRPGANGNLIVDSAGNIYGTTAVGGSSQAGTVYRLDPQGNETDLYTFSMGIGDGQDPNGGLLLDSAGNLYGTTYYGGFADAGTVFKLDTSAHETILYNFTGTGDGANPNGSLIMDGAGNLYGTTSTGGAAGVGTVFMLDTAGHQTTLYSVTGADGDGSNPNGGLIMDSAGNLSGVTYSGGSTGFGSVFRIDTAGHETVLSRFFTNGDGSYPVDGVVMDSAGNLYGATSGGGSAGAGTVFKLDANGAETVLYSFTGTNGDGDAPNGGVILDSAGNLYGTTVFGGNGSCSGGCGTVFELDTHSNETVLYRFNPANGDGFPPNGGLVMDGAGNLYGTAVGGGTSGSCNVGGVANQGCGTVFKVDTNGNETVLYTFTGSNGDGAFPSVGLVMDSAGNLYGTTFAGGSFGNGTVFKLDAKENETVLYSFTEANGDGFPGSVIMDSAGNLYGTTNAYGPNGLLATLYKLDPKGNETLLYSFTSANGGPNSGLVIDSSGNLYGTTSGGSANLGTVFKLDPAGHETTQYSFTGGIGDGSLPNGELIIDGDGNLFGTTQAGGSASCSLSGTLGCGTVFELAGAVSGNFTLAASALSPASVGTGQSASSDLTITSLYGFNSTVSLTCSVSPKLAVGPTCAVSPASVTPAANGTASSTLTVSTTNASASVRFPGRGARSYSYFALWLLVPAMFLLGPTSRDFRKHKGVCSFLTLVLFTAVASEVGCGSGSSTQPGTPAGNYTITVTALSGSSMIHSTTVTVSVQ